MPSSSAAIWLSTVCTPVPMSCTLASTTAPSRRSRTRRGAGKPEAAHRAGGHAVTDHPRAVPARPLVPGAPPVTAGPLLVGLAQAIARPRPAVSGRDLGEVGQPDVERVQAGGVGQLVHGALQGPQPGPLDRRPHRRGHVQADPLDQLPQPQGRHGVQRLAGLGGRLDVGVGQGRVVDDLVLEAEQHAVGGRAEPDRLLHPRLVAHVAELVRAPQVQLDRAACHPGRGGREDFVRPDVALGAEPAAGVRRHHVHVRGVEAERGAHHADDGRARLHRVP